jgi:hypothetical protein
MRYVPNRIDSKAALTSSAHRVAQLQYNSVAVLNDQSFNLNAIKSANDATLDTRRDYTRRAKSALVPPEHKWFYANNLPHQASGVNTA